MVRKQKGVGTAGSSGEPWERLVGVQWCQINENNVWRHLYTKMP